VIHQKFASFSAEERFFSLLDQPIRDSDKSGNFAAICGTELSREKVTAALSLGKRFANGKIPQKRGARIKFHGNAAHWRSAEGYGPS
jgi:hypothetical protein